MDQITKSEQLANAGRFREALEVLEQLPRRDTRSHDVLRAELLEAVGRHDEAQECVMAVLRIQGISDEERGRAEFVLSRVHAENGDLDAELAHVRKAILHSERAKDFRSVCFSQFRLLHLIADRSGPDAARGLMKQVRNNVTRLGDPRTTAGLHLFVSELDGKRGLLSTAFKHTEISRRLLEANPNLWLQAWTQNNLLVFALLQSDLDSAQHHGRLALAASMESGAVDDIRRCLFNLGRLHMSSGSFETALDYLQRGLNHARPLSEHARAALDNIARVRLSEHRVKDGLSLLDEVENNTSATAKGRYVHRHSLLTKAELLARSERYPEAIECLDQVSALANQARDNALAATASMLRYEVTQLVGQSRGVVPFPESGASLEQSALSERVLAVALARAGNRTAGRAHFARAQRMHTALQNAPAQIELERSWLTAQGAAPAGPEPQVQSSAMVLQSIATLLAHAGKPDVVATELIAMLAHVTCAVGAMAIARDEHGVEKALAAHGRIPTGDSVRTLSLGSSRNRTIELRLQPLDDIESQATVNGIEMLLRAAGEVIQARTDREERLMLWPIEQLPREGDDSVILGEMEKLMITARRVAATNAAVLITGESGTGKEILARAIHDYSTRARKAFVPFNCTAVARDLVESQLFGHRRGSFTGADRDAPGLVRSAKEGTLFLDEVGEMALDLQPKLLRFLESGEISPLGEATPFNVDVRIIAATNADLDQLVEHGRFREDLFYRLNVVRLTIPPLRERRDEIPALVHHFVAKASHEFAKKNIRLAEETMEELLLFSWPGNIRQLQNEIRRIVALADHDAVIEPTILSMPIRQEAQATAGRSVTNPATDTAAPQVEKLGPMLSRVERQVIKAALAASNGKLEAAAKALGISRKGLYLKRQRLGV